MTAALMPSLLAQLLGPSAAPVARWHQWLHALREARVESVQGAITSHYGQWSLWDLSLNDRDPDFGVAVWGGPSYEERVLELRRWLETWVATRASRPRQSGLHRRLMIDPADGALTMWWGKRRLYYWPLAVWTAGLDLELPEPVFHPNTYEEADDDDVYYDDD